MDKKKIGNGKTLLHELPFVNLESWSVDGTTLIINSEKIQGED